MDFYHILIKMARITIYKSIAMPAQPYNLTGDYQPESTVETPEIYALPPKPLAKGGPIPNQPNTASQDNGHSLY